MQNNYYFTKKWDEAQILFKEFKLVTFGNKKHLMAMIEHVKPEELLKYVDFSNIIIIDKQTMRKTAFPGTLFISDERIFFRRAIQMPNVASYYEYPFKTLRSVSSRGNGLTGGKIKFSTDEHEVTFLVSYHATVIARVTEIIDCVIKTAVEVQQKALGTTIATIAAVECGRCGAVNVLEENTSVPCEYCDRPLVFSRANTASEVLANQCNTQSAISAADELMKFKALLDSGVITEDEFAQKKKQLLGL
ncbi:MAG: SHOCT domain-containing protein [Oscillospiraceae bacterium]|nr:SHOCT domain-containing protein [Oscillospiraceae bacterium]